MYIKFELDAIPLWYYCIYFTIILLVYVSAFCKIKNRENIIKRNTYPFLLCFILFAIFYCVDTDYFGYRNLVENIFSISEDVYLEPVYQYIALLVHQDYLLFRFIVWGGSLICIYNSLKILNITPYFSLLILFILYNNTISYARASLAMAIYFLGFSILISRRQHNYIQKIIGILIILISQFFHKQMVIPILITPILLVPAKRKYILIYWGFLFLGLYVVLKYFINNIGSINNILDDGYMERMDIYNEMISDGVFGGFNINGFIQLCIRYALFILPILQCGAIIYGNNYGLFKVSKIINIYKIIILLLFISVIFALLYGFNNVYCYRILYVTMIPICMILGYLYQENKISIKYIRFLIILGLLYQASIYLSIFYNNI